MITKEQIFNEIMGVDESKTKILMPSTDWIKTKDDKYFTEKEVKEALIECQHEDKQSMGEHGFINRYMFRVLKKLGLEE